MPERGRAGRFGKRPSLFPSWFGNLEWILGLMLLGAIGYALIEGWSLSDGLFMTIITISTVGFGETNELSPIGRAFTSFLIFLSVVGMTCWTAQITSTFVSGEITGQSAARRMKKMIESLSEHTIIFGSGMMARRTLERLQEAGKPCVLVDQDSEAMHGIRRRHPDAMTLMADPKCELTLSDANIFSAKHIVAALDEDFDNLLVAMSVKELDPSITVIARSNDPRVASRMLKIGVDSVICPFQLSGDHVADLVTGKVELEHPFQI